MPIAKIFEVYGQASNGARHNLGNYFAQDIKGAIRQAKRDFSNYSTFSACLEDKVTKNEFYSKYYNHNHDWSQVVFKG